MPNRGIDFRREGISIVMGKVGEGIAGEKGMHGGTVEAGFFEKILIFLLTLAGEMITLIGSLVKRCRSGDGDKKAGVLQGGPDGG